MFFVLMAMVVAVVLSFTTNPSAQIKTDNAEIYSVAVDYSKTLVQMIQTGQYVRFDGEITAEHFPITGKGKEKVNLQLVHLNREVRSGEALSELNRRGLRPATLPELLAFGAKYPELQREFTILALGSVWAKPSDFQGVIPVKDFLSVAYLDEDDGNRCLSLRWYGNVWYAEVRYLAVSK